MINLYSGTPGSGKSFHATEKIYYRLRAGENVICNYPIDCNKVKLNFLQYWISKIFRCNIKSNRHIGNFEYKQNDDITVQFLLDYARINHSIKKESETLLVLDECGIKFNPRTFNSFDRMEWIQFFSMHRHLGYDVILISQSDRMIDRQIRSFIEYDHRHRKINNYKAFGKILGLLSGGSLFIDVVYWYGIREKVNSEWKRFSSRIASCYDTMLLFNYEDKAEKETSGNESVPSGDSELCDEGTHEVTGSASPT